MSKFFNNKEVELLAPTGTFEIFKKVIKSNADAVYFGGKILNMRMHRKDYNFTNEEIKEAIKIAHSMDKKVYITVNNMLNPNEVNQAKEYLLFLNEVKPDGLIVQDFSIIKLINQMNLDLKIHSSVMMNVHNEATIKRLKELGVTRVVLSRELDLESVKALSKVTDMEFEYFTHGDMCVAHGAQCLYSGMIFGNSSNRGLCMKPCRWNFAIKKDGLAYKTEYPMAVKDMYMYEHIPEMIDSGIVSFKIEGRMRDADYLVELINYYGDAIDRYINDPICYDRKKDAESIYESRKRDLSTGYAFGKPGLKNINRRYEGTGKFYSHGKVFSNPIEEIETTSDRISQIKDTLSKESSNPSKKTLLSVKVNSYAQAKAALDENVDIIYLSGEVFQPDKPFSKEEIISLTKNKKSTKIYLGFPRMMYENDFSKYKHLIKENDLGIDGLLVTNLGAIYDFKDLHLDLAGDYCLNIYNNTAADFYKEEGLSSATLSVESPLVDGIQTIKNTSLPIEMIVQGSPVVMYLEHDLYENTKVLQAFKKEDNLYFNNNALMLVDDKGYEHPVYRDSNGRNHMLLYKDLCYLPFLKELNHVGVSTFRVEGCHYSATELKNILHVYREAINNFDKCMDLFSSLKPMHKGFTLGAFQFK